MWVEADREALKVCEEGSGASRGIWKKEKRRRKVLYAYCDGYCIPSGGPQCSVPIVSSCIVAFDERPASAVDNRLEKNPRNSKCLLTS